jgi:predicted alpha/beta hydrolase family esterase
MSRIAFRPLALLVALALPATAQEFGISGHDVAGRASIGSTTFRADVTTFSKDGGKARTIEGRVVARSATGLTLEHVEVTQERGFVDVLLFRDGEVTRRTVRTVLAAKDGGFEGALGGASFRLVPQSHLQAGTTILVVPGLSTNLWNQYGVPYLDENLQALKARGFEARRLAINTEESVAKNAADIAREVRAEIARGKKVLLVAHSKGGADTITALSDPANRDLLPHVRGLMAIQPVYGGSPIADVVGTNCIIQATADQFFERVLPKVNRVDDEGSRDAVRDLRSATRQALLRQHPYPVDRVPTVVVRSSFSDRSIFKKRHVLRKPLWVFQNFLLKTKGIHSDGMVSLEWQRVPGAKKEITLTDLDHFEPGFRGESPHSPCAITNQLIDAMAGVLK